MISLVFLRLLFPRAPMEEERGVATCGQAHNESSGECWPPATGYRTEAEIAPATRVAVPCIAGAEACSGAWQCKGRSQLQGTLSLAVQGTESAARHLKPGSGANGARCFASERGIFRCLKIPERGMQLLVGRHRHSAGRLTK